MGTNDMDDLNDLVLFAAVVQHGGFSAASRATGWDKTRLSRRVAGLEKRLGVRLLNRNTRRIALTEAGERLFHRCRTIIDDVRAAHESVADLRKEPSGTIRMICPQVMAQSYLTPILMEYLARYPKVNLEVESSDQEVSLIDGRYDLALRACPRMDETSGHVARPLSHAKWVLVASPSLLKGLGQPQNPEELIRFSTIARKCDVRDGQAQWRLLGPENREVAAPHSPRLISDDLRMHLEAAIRGVGLALLPNQIVANAIEQGLLQQALPEWGAAPNIIFLIYPTPRGMLPSVRSLIDYLTMHLPATLGPASAVAARVKSAAFP